ncbi:unnamed protein product, partial [Rotaria magnacalcarata]
MRIPFDEFLEKLVKDYKVESREQLGIFCRSFPYLTEVTRKLTYEHRRHNRQSELDARSEIMKIAQAKFAELIKEVKFEFQSPLDKKKKSPTIVFDHLISIVEKYLVVSEQKIVQDTLSKFRKDELLQCLFNVSICLGTMKKPDELMVELKKFYQYPIISTVQSATVQNPQLPHMNQSLHNKQYQPASSNQLSVTYRSRNSSTEHIALQNSDYKEIGYFRKATNHIDQSRVFEKIYFCVSLICCSLKILTNYKFQNVIDLDVEENVFV